MWNKIKNVLYVIADETMNAIYWIGLLWIATREE